MTTPTNTSGTIVAASTKTPEKKQTTMRAYIHKMEGEIKKALPSTITAERFMRMVFSAMSKNPQLEGTTPQSFLAAMMDAAQLGVEPNTPLGQAYLLPYKNKGVLECQFQLGYKGMIDLAYRSGNVVSIQAHEVCENDEFSYSFGLEPDLKHNPALHDRGAVYCYYAIFKTKDGGFGFEVMSREDIEKHAKRYSKSYGGSYSPWATNFDEMAKKTVLKRVLKYAPLHSDFMKAIKSDETIRYDIAPDMSEADTIDVDYTVDEETGEVKEG